MRFSLFFLFFFSFSLRRPCLRDTSARNGFVFSRQPPRLLVTGRRRNGRRGVKTKVVSVNHSDDAVSVVFFGFFFVCSNRSSGRAYRLFSWSKSHFLVPGRR